MNTIIDFILNLLGSGAGNLAAYLAAHVLLCLLPAFFIAGAMTALIPKEIITKYLGRETPAYISYPAAAAAGFLLAVCSCTVIPLFAGIYKKGAGLGPAITFLFVAPAVNILAISYTGSIIGIDLAIARLVLSLVFGISIGILMALIFHKEDQDHDQKTSALFSGQAKMRPASIWFLLLLVALLIVGTFQIDLLKTSYVALDIPVSGAGKAQDFLNNLVPYDASRGEEGVSLQGAVLIGLLALIGLAAWKGLEKIHSGINRWTWLTLILAGATLLFASLSITPQANLLTIGITGKFVFVLLILAAGGWLLLSKLETVEVQDTLWETWRFMKQIFPLLIVGVFIVGMIRVIIQPEWIQALAGENTFLGNFIGVVFGVFMYFPTLVEVPIAQMFLDLGMHRGPLLAYLISDPELSLQSILITASIIGRLKAWVFVGWVALFSTLAGLLYGAWVNGAHIGLIGLILLAGIAIIWGLSQLLKNRKALKA